MSAAVFEPEIRALDGHHWLLAAALPASPRAHLLWLPALGVAARHYRPFADALASHGIATWLHEWRGHGSSSLRPSRQLDWGYRELLDQDLPASLRALPPGPLMLGGHSLGGQLACCLAARHPERISHLLLVAAGSPWWRGFPLPWRWSLPPLYRFLPWLARRHGTLPGRRLGFGRTEARSLIADWARVGLTGRYAADREDTALDAALEQVRCQVHACVLAADWMAPPGSLAALLGKMPRALASTHLLDTAELEGPADHFSWMANPGPVAARLAGSINNPKIFHTTC
jgi:predicted alpha/beta hydrolase